MNEKYIFIILFFTLKSVISQTSEPVVPVSATTTLNPVDISTSLDRTIDGSGLSTFPSSTATHDNAIPGNFFNYR